MHEAFILGLILTVICCSIVIVALIMFFVWNAIYSAGYKQGKLHGMQGHRVPGGIPKPPAPPKRPDVFSELCWQDLVDEEEPQQAELPPYTRSEVEAISKGLRSLNELEDVDKGGVRNPPKGK